jgi:hypothetical protein
MTAKLALALILLTGCGENVAVSINCKTTAAPAVECELKQTKGKSEVEVCWDFSATCGNGAAVSAKHNCQKVKDGGTAQMTIPADKLEGLDKCGTGPDNKPPIAKVENMTLNGKPPS